MYQAFSRRLTSWYVGAATVGAALILLAFAVLSLVLYARLLDESAGSIAAQASEAGVRAELREARFDDAASVFSKRYGRPGITIVALAHRPPRFPGPPRRGQVLVNGVVLPVRGMRPGGGPGSPGGWRVPGSRYLPFQALIGGRGHHVAFDGGEMIISIDPGRLAQVALRLLAGIVLVTILAGVMAWVVGRYITSQVLRPLVDVTRSLRRFAARDFTPEPIAVAGRSEFDELAQAYNGAAAQVDAAFAERSQAEARMRQFVADAGHELRTPLAIVLGFCDVLKRKVDPQEPTANEAFASIDAQGRRMRALIDNLILLARMESQHARPMEPFPLCALIDEVVGSRRVLAQDVRIDLDLAVDATILGDRDELHEALANVVDNALKYAPGAPIAIATRSLDATSIEIAIRDAGPGVPPEHAETVFERFFRAMPHRGEIEGSGLGLAIARRAAERAGGGLALIANGPHGATFAFRLRAHEIRSREPSLTS
ncbi:MAG: ATP-binding protein [Vulcanimicrobiaceae bacterium]